MRAPGGLTRRDVLTLAAGGLGALTIAGPVAALQEQVVPRGGSTAEPIRRIVPKGTWLAFDIIGTVFDVYGSLAKGIGALAKQYGRTLAPDKYTRGWISGYAGGVQSVNNGQAWTPPDQLLKAAFSAMLAQDHVPALSAAQLDSFFQLWRTLDPWPDVAKGMQRLDQHFGLAILSNMSVATQSGLRQHAGLPFDRLLSAEAVKAYKPTPVVYQHAVSALGVKPQHIIMVAAHKYDLQAAKAQGFRTAFVKRPLELGPAGNVDTTSDPGFNWNVNGLEELAARLGA